MRVLDDLLVIDFSRVLAGPYCTMHLADMGAKVIKIEHPKVGDDTRHFGPPFVNGQSTYYLSLNRGKYSMALDLKNPKDREKALALIQKADVVVENFRPGTMDRLGLGWEKLKAMHPKLIYASISGYGAVWGEQRYLQKAGYDLILQGLSGIQSITGPRDGSPHKCGISIGDLSAGLYCVQGILLALRARDRWGIGQRVDISMQDALTSLLTYHATAQMMADAQPKPLGNDHPNIVPYTTFPTRKGYVNIAAGNDRMFQRLCQALDLPELCKDPRFESNAQRVVHRQALFEILSQKTRTYDKEVLVQKLEQSGVVAGPILGVKEAVNHPQMHARKMIVEQEHVEVGTIKTIGSPIHLEQTPPQYPKAPPLLDEDRDYIFEHWLNTNSRDF